MDTTKRVMKEIMRRVLDARKRAGLTQAEVAAGLNISDTTFNGYETLNRTMSIPDLVKLPAILGCRITDLLPDSWVTDENNRLTYSALRCLIQRRAARAGVKAPSLHSFRRAFALLSLRAGMDVYSLQKLMGHADLTVLRRYLAQTEDDLREAHQKAGLVDRLL